MTYCIEKYLTGISRETTTNWNTGEEETYWRFTGDGQGDWEQYSRLTTKECLETYIKLCQEQIELAKQCIQDTSVFKEE